MRRALEKVGKDLLGVPHMKRAMKLGESLRILIYGFLSCNFLMARISDLNKEERYIVCVQMRSLGTRSLTLYPPKLFSQSNVLCTLLTFADSFILSPQPDTADSLSHLVTLLPSHCHELAIHFSHPSQAPYLAPLLSSHHPTPALIPPTALALTSLLIANQHSTSLLEPLPLARNNTLTKNTDLHTLEIKGGLTFGAWAFDLYPLLRVLKLEHVWISLGLMYDGEGLRYLNELVVKEVRVWERRPLSTLQTLNEDLSAVVKD
jgi:hypothetical protein